MKRLILSSILLVVVSAEAKFANPFGAQIIGAGSTLVSRYMKTLISSYNKSYPCPKFIYKQTPASLYAGSDHGVARVLEDTVTFAVSLESLDATTVNDAPDCLLQIPFILTSLSIIYRLPNDFGPGKSVSPNSNWPGRLNISPADLCGLYTVTTFSSPIFWGSATPGVGLLRKAYNGSQTYTATLSVNVFARADYADETGLLVKYLNCSNPSPTGDCAAFLSAPNVTNDPNGPFCSAASGLNLSWGLAVTCLPGSDAIANAVATADGLAGRPNGAIGYVGTDIALASGFSIPTPVVTGPAGTGFPLGIAGLFVQGSTLFTSPQQNAQDNPANYTQPTNTAVQAAMMDCIGGEYLCKIGAYPIVTSPLFVLYATQPVDLIACNIIQFIQFALGLNLNIPGLIALPNDCVMESFAQLDQVRSAICEPCVEPCNPCLNQTCAFPTCLPCKG